MLQSPFQFATLWLTLLALLVSCGDGSASGEEDRAAGPNGRIQFEGTILEVVRSASRLIVEDENGQMWAVALGGGPAILAEDGSVGSQIELLPGLPVDVRGEPTGRDAIRPDTVRILEFPSILLVHPRAGAAIDRPIIVVEGYSYRGRTPRYRLRQADSTIVQGTFSAEAFGARRYGAFRGNVQLVGLNDREGIVLELWLDGEDEDQRLSRPIRVTPERTLTLYFPNRDADPRRIRCDGVYPLTRRSEVLLSPNEVVSMLMEELPREDRRRGFYSDVAMFGEPRSVTISGSIARVDVSRPAEGMALDSCSVVAAHAQLRRTLGETFGIDTVAVTVEGVRLVAGRGQ